MVPIIYKSTDTSAPVLAGNDRTCLVNLLNKCLVTGYGDRPAAGWTMPFTDAGGTLAGFRNNTATGTGFFFQMDHATTSYPYQFATRAYEAMSSESAGTLLFGSSTLGSMGSDTATQRPWYMIATDKWFLLHTMPSATVFPTAAALAASTATYSGTTIFFGDIVKLSESDGYACLYSSARSGYGASFGFVSVAGTTTSGHYLARRLSGVPGPVDIGISVAPPHKSGAYHYQAATFTDANGLFASKLYVLESVGTVVVPRGELERLLLPWQVPPYEPMETVSIDGTTYCCFKWANSSAICTLLVDMMP